MGIKKLKTGIAKGDFGGLVVGRSKSQQEIDTRIDQLAEEFQKTKCSEEMPQLESEGVDILMNWAICCRGVKRWITPIPKRWSGVSKKKRNDPKRREE